MMEALTHEQAKRFIHVAWQVAGNSKDVAETYGVWQELGVLKSSVSHTANTSYAWITWSTQPEVMTQAWESLIKGEREKAVIGMWRSLYQLQAMPAFHRDGLHYKARLAWEWLSPRFAEVLQEAPEEVWKNIDGVNLAFLGKEEQLGVFRAKMDHAWHTWTIDHHALNAEQKRVVLDITPELDHGAPQESQARWFQHMTRWVGEGSEKQFAWLDRLVTSDMSGNERRELLSDLERLSPPSHVLVGHEKPMLELWEAQFRMLEAWEAKPVRLLGAILKAQTACEKALRQGVVVLGMGGPHAQASAMLKTEYEAALPGLKERLHRLPWDTWLASNEDYVKSGLESTRDVVEETSLKQAIRATILNHLRGPEGQASLVHGVAWNGHAIDVPSLEDPQGSLAVTVDQQHALMEQRVLWSGWAHGTVRAAVLKEWGEGLKATTDHLPKGALPVASSKNKRPPLHVKEVDRWMRPWSVAFRLHQSNPEAGREALQELVKRQAFPPGVNLFEYSHALALFLFSLNPEHNSPAWWKAVEEALVSSASTFAWESMPEAEGASWSSLGLDETVRFGLSLGWMSQTWGYESADYKNHGGISAVITPLAKHHATILEAMREKGLDWSRWIWPCSSSWPDVIITPSRSSQASTLGQFMLRSMTSAMGMGISLDEPKEKDWAPWIKACPASLCRSAILNQLSKIGKDKTNSNQLDLAVSYKLFSWVEALPQLVQEERHDERWPSFMARCSVAPNLMQGLKRLRDRVGLNESYEKDERFFENEPEKVASYLSFPPALWTQKRLKELGFHRLGKESWTLDHWKVQAWDVHRVQDIHGLQPGRNRGLTLLETWISHLQKYETFKISTSPLNKVLLSTNWSIPSTSTPEEHQSRFLMIGVMESLMSFKGAQNDVLNAIARAYPWTVPEVNQLWGNGSWKESDRTDPDLENRDSYVQWVKAPTSLVMSIDRDVLKASLRSFWNAAAILEEGLVKATSFFNMDWCHNLETLWEKDPALVKEVLEESWDALSPAQQEKLREGLAHAGHRQLQIEQIMPSEMAEEILAMISEVALFKAWGQDTSPPKIKTRF